MKHNAMDPRLCTSDRTARLTEAQVVAIRRDTRLLKQIAADYHVTMANISKIRRGGNWKWVDENFKDKTK